MDRTASRTASRAFCLFLSLLVLFLSYKPAVALLSFAGAARNPTEGGNASGNSAFQNAPENLPRPARKQQRQSSAQLVQKVQKSRTVSPDEKILLQLLLAGSRSGSVTISERTGKIANESAQPEYMKQFLPVTPGGPHSPPA